MSELWSQRCLPYLRLSALRRVALVCTDALSSSVRADGGWWVLVPLEFAAWLVYEYVDGGTTFERHTALLMVGMWSVANVLIMQSDAGPSGRMRYPIKRRADTCAMGWGQAQKIHQGGNFAATVARRPRFT
jgi:hypothetical protein